MLNPYRSVPKPVFLRRVAPLTALVFGVSLSIMGVLAKAPFLAPNFKLPSLDRPALLNGFAQYGALIRDAVHLPETCAFGENLGEFEASRCRDVEAQLLIHLILAMIPFLVTGLVCIVGYRKLVFYYGKMALTFRRKRSTLTGIATNPIDAPLDLYGWSFCLQAFTVELPNQVQLKVYLPGDAPRPLPGQKFVLLDMGKTLGERRYHARLYAPHLAVVKGGH